MILWKQYKTIVLFLTAIRLYNNGKKRFFLSWYEHDSLVCDKKEAF